MKPSIVSTLSAAALLVGTGETFQVTNQAVKSPSSRLGNNHLQPFGLLRPSVSVNLKRIGDEDNQRRGDRDMSALLNTWSGSFGGVPPWDQIKPEDFAKAFDVAIKEASIEIERIANAPTPASFENTIVALEQCSKTLDRLEALFGVHSANLNVGPIPDIERTVRPKQTEFMDSVTQNQSLFERIKSVYEGKHQAELNPVQERLVDDYYQRFVRQGALLNDADKTKLSKINQQLSTLYTDFSQNILAEEAGHVTWIENEADLAGLPKSTIAAMASAASELGQAGKWAVTNTRSSMEPFLTDSDNRALRKQVWQRYYSRGDNGDQYDNKQIISDILQLRAQRAELLGYETHAHWQLEPTMAKTPETTMKLMTQVWEKAVARVAEEVADMQEIADAEGEGVIIEPWDYRYYAEKVRQERYDLDFNEVKPYLQLENLREGMMWAAGELYGLQFEPVEDIPVFHSDVRVWEVSNREGDHVGLFYFDPYARTGKHSGAWMTSYRVQHNVGEAVTPIVSNNCNFVKGEPGEPVLISWDDAVTLFHEFGHGLHGLLSKVDYPSQSGTAVARDYVEFPSQLNEHWLSTPEVLNRFAVHYQTGEPMPDALLEKIHKASTFNQGFSKVEYLANALIDMKLHLAGAAEIDPAEFERETLAELGMPKEIVMRHRTPQFAHIFSGDGYSAGYYSYLWSDVLTADAAEAFEEAGSYYDKDVANRLYDNVISKGDTIDPAEGFRTFRGRNVDTDALFRKLGFPVD